MPDLQTDYRAVVAAARDTTAALTRRSLAELRLAYARLLAAVVEEAARASGANAERLTQRSRAVRAALAAVEARIVALETDARRGARVMGDGHSEAIRLVVAEVAPSYAVAASFETVPERAVEALLRRRQVALGLEVPSYSSLFKSVAQSASAGVLEELDGVLLRGVGRGADTRTVALQIAEALTEGDPALRTAVERLAPSLRRSGATLTGAGEARAVAEDLGEARQLLIRARRLARTEVLSVAMEADRLGQHESPVVRATRWQLSGAHPPGSGCECEVFARMDLYRFGTGVFPTNAVPSRPHAFCACVLIPITRGPAEWDRPKPTADEPAGLTRYPFETRPDGTPYTEAHRQRITASVNAHLAAAVATSEVLA